MSQDGGYSAQGATPAQAPSPAVQQLQAMPPVAPKPKTHDVTVVTTRKLAQAKVLGCPPEEFGIERGARDIKTANYAFHEVVTKTEADLIAEGFDEDQVKAIGDYIGTTDPETQARDSVSESSGPTSTNTSARMVKVTEHYVRMDYQGNGKPCLYMVITGGDQGEILKRDGKEVIQPIDTIPLATTTPVPVTHRFFGRSVADLVMQIQREKTALKRGALDNLYLHNNPRVEVAEQNAGPNTLDDLLVSRPGGVVRTKMAGGLNWQTVPDITTSIYPMLQYLDAELESRTGVSKQSQGLDANALQNQSATAVAQVFSSSQMRMKLIARIMAEGVRDVFALLHHTIRTHGSEKVQTVRLRNKWVEVDPRNWKTRDDMTINVGLGSGGKAQQFAQIMALGNVQKEFLAGGKANLVDDQKLFNTASELTKVMGHKNPDRFFNDPSEKNGDGSPKYPPIAPPLDPKVMAVQEQAKSDQAELAMKAQFDKQKAQDAADLAKFKADIDAKLKIIDAHLKSVEMERKAAHDQQAHKTKMVETVVELAATAHQHDMAMAHDQQTHDAKLEQMKSQPKPKGDK